jgi:hypothetical protein
VIQHADASWRIAAPESSEEVEPGEPPTLSVIIPYFRGADVIRQAVESVLAQTRPPDEIVICDDGSPDDLAGALGSLLPRVKIVRQENGGFASAMNTASSAARGEFVAQLDQDDAFLPGRLEAIANASAARPDLDIIATEGIIECLDRRVPVGFNAGFPVRRIDQRARILRTCFFCWPAIRRSRLLSVGGYAQRFVRISDWECFMRLILEGAVAGLIQEPLYLWRLTPGSLSTSASDNAEEVVLALRSALASGKLTPAEREVAESTISWRHRSAVLERARHSIEMRWPDARRRSLGVLLSQGFPAATRAKTAVAVASPALARRYLARRGDRDALGEALARRGLSRHR